MSGLEMWVLYGENDKVIAVFPDKDSGMIAYATTPEATALIRYFHETAEESEDENE